MQKKKIEKTANHIICAILPPKLYKLLKKTALDIIFTRNCKGYYTISLNRNLNK